MFGYSFLQVIWYFLIYSVLGWCVEVIYCTVNDGKVTNRGYLNGPVCPIYGFGMVMVLFLLRIAGFSDVTTASVPILFIGGMVLASAVEFLGGWGLMKLFGMRWWDYSSRPFNIGGYICLQFSIVWGLGAVAVIRIVQAPLSRIVENRFFAGIFMIIVCIAACIIYLIDFVMTTITVIGLSKRIKELDEIAHKLRMLSDELSTHIGTGALDIDRRVDETKVQAALGKMELEQKVEELEERAISVREKLSGGRLFGAGRIMSAFPELSKVNGFKSIDSMSVHEFVDSHANISERAKALKKKYNDILSNMEK